MDSLISDNTIVRQQCHTSFKSLGRETIIHQPNLMSVSVGLEPPFLVPLVMVPGTEETLFSEVNLNVKF